MPRKRNVLEAFLKPAIAAAGLVVTIAVALMAIGQYRARFETLEARVKNQDERLAKIEASMQADAIERAILRERARPR